MQSPQRGSFPLDHDGRAQYSIYISDIKIGGFWQFATGECKNFMTPYLDCIKKVKGVNEELGRKKQSTNLTLIEHDLWAKKSLNFTRQHQIISHLIPNPYNYLVLFLVWDKILQKSLFWRWRICSNCFFFFILCRWF